MMRQFVLMTFTLFVTCNVCLAQDAKMIVEISQDTILMGNYIQLRYSLENASGNFEMPELDGLMVVSGPNTSTSMSMINGQVSQKASYTVYLQPIDIGSHHIGPAYIKTDNGDMESQPITITVIDNPTGLQENPRSFKIIEEIQATKDGIKSKKKAKRYKI